MSTETQTPDPLRRLRREIERNATRARNGIRYLSGTEWSTPNATPRDVIWNQGKVTLWRYRSDKVRLGPPLLLMMGLVSRTSVFDLHPRTSFVRALRDRGFDVFLIDWGVPDPGDAGNTIETYVDRLLPRAVAAITRATGSPEVCVIGYCMGGNFALLATARGLPVRNLVVMATAVDFTRLSPNFTALLDPEQSIDGLIDDETGLVSPNLVEAMFRIRKPTAGAVQYANLLENLWNDRYVEGHQAIARWTADHIPLPGAAVRQALQTWLRDNGFLNGTLVLGGRPVDLSAIRCPVFVVTTSRDEVVPPQAARPLAGLVGSDDVEELEINAGHIGLIIGRSAHEVSFPGIIGWLETRSTERGAA